MASGLVATMERPHAATSPLYRDWRDARRRRMESSKEDGRRQGHHQERHGRRQDDHDDDDDRDNRRDSDHDGRRTRRRIHRDMDDMDGHWHHTRKDRRYDEPSLAPVQPQQPQQPCREDENTRALLDLLTWLESNEYRDTQRPPHHHYHHNHHPPHNHQLAYYLPETSPEGTSFTATSDITHTPVVLLSHQDMATLESALGTLGELIKLPRSPPPPQSSSLATPWT